MRLSVILHGEGLEIGKERGNNLELKEVKRNTELMDYIEYVTEKATVNELKMQNSYFINSLYGNAGNGSA